MNMNQELHRENGIVRPLVASIVAVGSLAIGGVLYKNNAPSSTSAEPVAASATNDTLAITPSVVASSELPTIVATTEVASTTTTLAGTLTAEEIATVNNVLSESLRQKAYDCVVDGANTGTLKLNSGKGGAAVIPKLNSNIANIDVDKTTQDNRRWSDAIANPMTSETTDKVAMLAEFNATMCEDPLVTEMVATYFANLKIGGKSVIDMSSD
jgi:hypothetical protein